MHRTLQDVLWLVPATLEFAIAVNMFRRNLVRDYPVFWNYLLLVILRTFVLFGIGNDKNHYARYFYTYWLTEVVACLLGFFVVAEIFGKAFAKRLGLQGHGTAVFRLSLVALLVAALLVALLSPGSDSSKLIAAILIIKRAESLVQGGLIAALFVFVFLLGLPWTSYTIGIALGFGIQGAVEVVALAARTHYGKAANRPVMWSLLAAGFCQVFVWAGYLLGRRAILPNPAAPQGHLSMVSGELERLNEQVGILLERRC